MDRRRPSEPKNVLPELIIPGLALAFTAYYLTTITEVPWISQASAVTVGTLLVASIVAFGIRTAYRIRQGAEKLTFEGLELGGRVNLQRLGLFALTVAYVATIDSLGFTLTTAIFIFAGIVVLSSPRRWRLAAILAVGCSITGYVVFIHLFKTRFPKGWIETTLQGLL